MRLFICKLRICLRKFASMNIELFSDIISRNLIPEVCDIDFTASEKCGVYCLFNSATGNYYVGYSRNCKARISNHIQCLLEGSHHAELMQKEYKTSPLSMLPFVIEYTESTMAAKMLEAYWLVMSDRDRLYNTQSAWFSLPSEKIMADNGSFEVLSLARNRGISRSPIIWMGRPVYVRIHFSLQGLDTITFERN